MKRIPRIVVALDTRMGAARDCLRGIAAFVEEHGPWDCNFTLVELGSSATVNYAATADGMIIQPNSQLAVAAVALLKMPIVVVGAIAPPRKPQIHVDNSAIGRLAARHFIERGFRRFGYCASFGDLPAMQRGNAFAQAVKSVVAARCEWLTLKPVPSAYLWRPGHNQFLKWLRKIPKPIGVFCASDSTAREVAMTCWESRIAVPAEVAILGSSNDEMQCLLCKPQLSSIDIGAREVGYQAAKLLQRMLDGHAVPPKPVIIPPVRVVVRESTDIVTVEDPQVARVVRYIQDYMEKGVNVKQLVRDLDLGRRSLEMAFREHLGRTIHREIVRAQVRRACQLLEDDRMSLMQIATKCGMRRQSYFNDFFKKHMHATPLTYRKTHRRQF